MKARGAPVIASFLAPTITPVVTRDTVRIKPLKAKTTGTTEARAKRVRTLGQKRTKKPPDVTGYYWRQDGAGWELRKPVYVEENGARKRKQPYVGHLSREAFQEMKRKHRGAALEKAVTQWIADHDR